MANNKPKRDESKTHCLYGHLLEGNNLYLLKSGQKRCKTCHKENRNKRDRKIRAQRRSAEGLF